MAGKTIIYGEILTRAEQQRLQEDGTPFSEAISWRRDLEPPRPEENPVCVFVDLDNPIYASANFLTALSKLGTSIKVIGKASYPDINEAMRVSRLGVSEVLTPKQCFQRLHEFMEELKQIGHKTPGHNTRLGIDKLIGQSQAMQEIRKTIRLLSDVDFPSALILGETGTGKSYICKLLHSTGGRAAHNLVEVNCSAIPDELFESELFGHVKGAFTDAKSEKIGLFEYAQNGTLFLDEVGSLSSSAQAKLLKILEDKKLRRVGDIGEKDINVRVVAATNMNFEEAIHEGRFREDLYFRLNLLVIEIPPLRERPEDIPALAEHYLGYYAGLYGSQETVWSQPALQALRQHSWPGNVRELCNVIERVVLLSKGREITAADIEAACKKGRVTLRERQQLIIEVPAHGISLDELELNIVKQVLDMCEWNKSEAARFLKISRPRLRRILEDSGLEQNRRKA